MADQKPGTNDINAFIKAAGSGDMTTVERLYQQYGSEIINAVDNLYGDTALISAVVKGQRKIVAYLMEKGADPALKNKSAKLNAIDIAKTKADPAILRLLENEAPLVDDGASILQEEFSTPDASDAIDALQDAVPMPAPAPTALENAVDIPENVDTVTPIDTFTFVWAASAGEIDGMKSILNKKNDTARAELLNKAKADGMTPLAAAALNGKVEAFEFLLNQGADTNVSVPFGSFSHQPLLQALEQRAAQGEAGCPEVLALLKQKLGIAQDTATAAQAAPDADAGPAIGPGSPATDGPAIASGGAGPNGPREMMKLDARYAMDREIMRAWGINEVDKKTYEYVIRYANRNSAKKLKNSPGFEFELNANDGKKLAWDINPRDNSDMIHCPRGGREFDQNTAMAMVAMAQLRGWPSVQILRGTEEQKQMLWLAAKRLGMEIEGYEAGTGTSVHATWEREKAQRAASQSSFMNNSGASPASGATPGASTSTGGGAQGGASPRGNGNRQQTASTTSPAP